MNLAAMLSSGPTIKHKVNKSGNYSGTKRAEAIRAKSQARYAEIFKGDKLTTSEVANRRGISHMGCLSTLYDYEQQGLVERVGMVQGNGNRKTVVWRWVDGD